MSFSLIFSLLNIFVMTIEKYEIMKNSLKTPIVLRFSYQIILFILIFCIIIALIPILKYPVNKNN